MKKDKRQHLVMGVITSLAVGFLTYLVSGEYGQLNVAAGVYAALSGGFVAGCVKEYCDTGYCLDPTRWDWKDIGFTLIGAVLVALFIVGLHYGRG
jgi:hypothetical protein